jgi:hypothetical protein
MKNFILLMAVQILAGFSASADANAITQWEDTIPLNPETALTLINEKASELTYQDKTGKVCGGETANYELADYFTQEDYDGLVTHNLYVKFYVTVPVDDCASEAVQVCQTKFAVTAEDDDVQMSHWKCEDNKNQF